MTSSNPLGGFWSCPMMACSMVAMRIVSLYLRLLSSPLCVPMFTSYPFFQMQRRLISELERFTKKNLVHWNKVVELKSSFELKPRLAKACSCLLTKFLHLPHSYQSIELKKNKRIISLQWFHQVPSNDKHTRWQCQLQNKKAKRFFFYLFHRNINWDWTSLFDFL